MGEVEVVQALRSSSRLVHTYSPPSTLSDSGGAVKQLCVPGLEAQVGCLLSWKGL